MRRVEAAFLQPFRPFVLLPWERRERGNRVPCASFGLWCRVLVGCNETHLRAMRILRVEPGGVDGGLGVRLYATPESECGMREATVAAVRWAAARIHGGNGGGESV